MKFQDFHLEKSWNSQDDKIKIFQDEDDFQDFQDEIGSFKILKIFKSFKSFKILENLAQKLDIGPTSAFLAITVLVIITD